MLAASLFVEIILLPLKLHYKMYNGNIFVVTESLREHHFITGLESCA